MPCCEVLPGGVGQPACKDELLSFDPRCAHLSSTKGSDCCFAVRICGTSKGCLSGFWNQPLALEKSPGSLPFPSFDAKWLEAVKEFGHRRQGLARVRRRKVSRHPCCRSQRLIFCWRGLAPVHPSCSGQTTSAAECARLAWIHRLTKGTKCIQRILQFAHSHSCHQRRSCASASARLSH